MVSSQNAFTFAFFAFFSFIVATPTETPPDDVYVQFPAYAREAPSRPIKLVSDKPAWNRVSRATCPLHTLDAGSEPFRRIVSETVEGSGSASSSSCLHKYVIAPAVALFVSVVLNLALIIRLMVLNRRRHVAVGIIPLRDVPRSRFGDATPISIAIPSRAQMASTDSTATLVPRLV
ncbi:hypothetical protein MSAN_01378300 [Mycena sanguinolenta]|uniref:Uncharacterized protein n=1 Tax=Mycena sanguinolenta TaxID=230812 RepID=A0A8H6Y8N4_9AGAR|nr:hypothetical protein MSAN_01378300 [Mycena sanguinolenta]